MLTTDLSRANRIERPLPGHVRFLAPIARLFGPLL